jgi:hypothetical protein
MTFNDFWTLVNFIPIIVCLPILIAMMTSDHLIPDAVIREAMTEDAVPDMKPVDMDHIMEIDNLGENATEAREYFLNVLWDAYMDEQDHTPKERWIIEDDQITVIDLANTNQFDTTDTNFHALMRQGQMYAPLN